MISDWHDRLTVIVTTSPLPRHPCSSMIEAILRSLQHYGGVAGCRVIIVADGYEACVGEGQLAKWKRGKIADDAAARYELHKQRVRAACAARAPPFQDAELMEQVEHRGFALGVRRAVAAARTEFVLVVQHDRPLIRAAPLEELVAAMSEQPELTHVALPTGRTQPGTYEHLAASKYAIKLEARCVRSRGLRFVPLLQFYDSTHLSRRDAYVALFADRACGFSNGDFIEDRIGQLQLRAIRADGLAAHAWHGQHVLDDGDERIMVAHLDGRDLRGLAKLLRWDDAAGATGATGAAAVDDDVPATPATDAAGVAAVAPGAAAPAAAALADGAADAVELCSCHGCTGHDDDDDDDAAPGHRAVVLELLVHRTSRGCARVAQHGVEGYQKRVGARVLTQGQLRQRWCRVAGAAEAAGAAG